MDYLDQYEIPIQSIQNGLHHFNFEVDQAFFSCFEETPIKEGFYNTELVLDKRDNEFLLNFEIEGFFKAPCDRCLAEIEIPAKIKKLIWVKYSMDGEKEANDEDIIFIAEDDEGFNVGSLLYELIVLSIPMVMRYDCENDENPKCDFKVLAYLDKGSKESEGNLLGDQFRKFREK